MRGLYAFVFDLQTRVENPAIPPLEKLADDREVETAPLLVRGPNPTLYPAVVIRNGASRRPPAETQEARVGAILGKRQVRGVRLVVGHIEREVGDAHDIHSSGVLSLLAKLQGAHATTRLSATCSPPRDHGTT